MMTLNEIESLTKIYADDYNDLADKVQALTDQIEALKRKALPAIKRAVERASQNKAALDSAIDKARNLFDSPRTVVFHGIKVGLRKSKGGIDFDSAERVVELIRKRYKDDEADALLNITEKPDKKALEKLTAGELKQLGCEIVHPGDAVVIERTAGEVDKVVNALLKGATEEAQAEAA